MKTTRRRQRTARKLVLPMLAIGLMTMMMYLDSANRPQPTTSGSSAPAAARVPHGLHQR